MNKQELIKRISELPYSEGPIADIVTVNRNWILGSIEQLDEPQKVTIPQFVAEYIEFKKKYDFHVYGAMREIEDHYDKRVSEWFYENNIETFVRAWIDGYEVEEEPKYIVKMKGLETNFSFLNLNKAHNHWMFSSKNECDIYQVRHTRKELEEADFGWVFNCPGIEVKEVKE